MPELNPFVYWAQTETDICLRVDLKDMKDTEITIEEDEMLTKIPPWLQPLSKYPIFGESLL